MQCTVLTHVMANNCMLLSDVEVCMKKWCGTEFNLEKIAPTDIHQCLLNNYGHQTVDVSTERWQVVCFSSSDSGSLQLKNIYIYFL